MSIYNLRPYIGGLPLVGGYIKPPYINTDGAIKRNFTTLDSAFGMYFPIPTYQMSVGDTVEFKYLAPSSVTADTDELIGGDVTGGSDAHFRMLSGGAFAEAGFENTFLLDGGSVSTTSTYPIDGKFHSVKLTSNSTLSISAITGKQAATDTYSGIMYDFMIKDSSGRDYPIDEDWINSNALVDKETVLGSEIWTLPLNEITAGWVDNLDGSYTADGTQAGSLTLRVAGGSVNGTPYLNKLTISGYSAGSLSARAGGGAGGTPVLTANGSYDHTVTGSGGDTNFRVIADSDFIGTVSLISFKEALGYGKAANIDVDDSENFTFDGSVSPNTWTNDDELRVIEVAGT